MGDYYLSEHDVLKIQQGFGERINRISRFSNPTVSGLAPEDAESCGEFARATMTVAFSPVFVPLRSKFAPPNYSLVGSFVAGCFEFRDRMVRIPEGESIPPDAVMYTTGKVIGIGDQILKTFPPTPHRMVPGFGRCASISDPVLSQRMYGAPYLKGAEYFVRIEGIHAQKHREKGSIFCPNLGCLPYNGTSYSLDIDVGVYRRRVESDS